MPLGGETGAVRRDSDKMMLTVGEGASSASGYHEISATDDCVVESVYVSGEYGVDIVRLTEFQESHAGFGG